jgi:hypothetical protein
VRFTRFPRVERPTFSERAEKRARFHELAEYPNISTGAAICLRCCATVMIGWVRIACCRVARLKD